MHTVPVPKQSITHAFLLVISTMKTTWYRHCIIVKYSFLSTLSLEWRHNEHHSVSDHQPHDCLINRLFRPRSNKTSKLRVTGLCAGNSPVTIRTISVMFQLSSRRESFFTSYQLERQWRVWSTLLMNCWINYFDFLYFIPKNNRFSLHMEDAYNLSLQYPHRNKGIRMRF